MHKQFGYCRVGAAVPLVRPGAVSENIASMAALARKAADAGADVLVFPELCITGYTCADLFFQSALLDAAEKGFELFLRKIWQCDTLFVVGMPLRADNMLFNCAVACRQGNILGVVPKTFLPNTREFYEKRWFSSAGMSQARSIRVCDEEVPFGTDLIFKSLGMAECAVGVEICEDLWSPVPPCTRLALNGATVLCNLSASNELVGKSEYRRDLVRQQSARCLAAYVYAGSGPGESSTDLVFGGHALIAENGTLLAENQRFSREPDLLLADVDVGYLAFERRQNCAYAQCAATAEPVRRIVYDAADETPVCNGLLRHVERQPFVPSDEAGRGSRCDEIFAVQAAGLATRLAHTGSAGVVVGVSGGLDSALALLVACESVAQAGL
ncbi:MAG: NAD(+) synthase, partial [Kiritimatiellae bacterium]|nr:NAD(+) synthase [Kiritimatiellia bacterium]